MPSWVSRLAALVSALAIVSGRGSPAFAQDTETELRNRVEQLEKRLGDIDKKAAADKAAEEKKKKEEEQKKKEAEEAWFAVGSDLGLKTSWRYGLYAETAHKDFKVHVGGRTQFDAVWMGANQEVQFGPGGTGRIDDGVNFRRGRFLIEGTLYEVVDFMCEWDFINTADVDPLNPVFQGDVINTPAPTDLWAQITNLPWLGVVRAGNMKPPLSFEHLTSSRWLNFMERSLAFDAFIGGPNNGFQPGLLMFNWAENERATWALGVFKNNQTVFGWNTGDGEIEIVGRVTALPVYEHDGRCLVHLGLGASHRDPDEDTVRLRTRTALRNGPAALHTRLLDIRMLGTSQDLVVPEFAMVWGPWTVQSEYFGVWVSDATVPLTPPNVNFGTCFFQSAYVEVLYFLTGEHRPYSKFGGSGAAFGRVIPHSNFFWVPGYAGSIWTSGAWQVGARYSWLDLNSKGVLGGVAHDVTLGLNWFLNPNMKVQWNYSVSHRDVEGGGSDGIIHGFGTRLAFDF
jgi:phosphate-selective porin OprO/OprP